MTTYAMGVDFGSTTAKTIILDGHGNIVASCIESMGAVSDEGVKASIAGALKQLGITQADVGFTVTTGYGRRMLDVSQKSYTEITCHARGAVALVPDARLVIDIGGQDSLARAVEIKLPEMGPLAMQATQALKISSMCATFAETEVISLLAEGHSKPDVLGAVHAAIASRTAGLVGRVGKRTPIVMTGGVAKNIAAVHHIETSLGQKLVLPPDPQIAGALGAALFALDEIRMAAKRSAIVDEEDRVVDSAMDGARACGPACKSTDAAAAGQVREIVVAPPTLRAAIN